jgi:deoxyribodipyrimidine photolyase
MERIGLIDMRFALRLTGNPLISKCKEEGRYPVFVYPLELIPKLIRDITPRKKEHLYGSIKEVKEELQSLGSDLILIDKDFKLFLEECTKLYQDLCIIYGAVYPDRVSSFLSIANELQIASIGVGEVTTCTSPTKSFKDLDAVTKACKSFNAYKYRDFIISSFKDIELDKKLKLPEQKPLESPFDFLNDMNKPNSYGGRTKGLSLMRKWLQGDVRLYNPPSIRMDPTSELGAYLKYGSISRQELFLATRKAEGSNLEGNYFYCESILRSEYILRVACRLRHKLNLTNTRRKKLSQYQMDIVKTWLKGETESKLANAAMKQLRLTGFVNHSLRYILVRTALEMNIPKWVILDAMTYLLVDSCMITTWYYIQEIAEDFKEAKVAFSPSLMENEHKGYIGIWSNPNIQVEPLTLTYE